MLAAIQGANACTGITLKTQSGTPVIARTIEWGGSNLNSKYSIVPRGHTQRSLVPDGNREGLKMTAEYGYIGLSVEQEEFIVEGLNEAGLSAGLFYFPNYGEYERYDASHKSMTICDLQLVSWMLGSFKTVDEIKDAIHNIYIVSIDPKGSTAHWRIADATGRQVVLEIIGKEAKFYENELGVLTNSPGYEWHVTNLNNYINLLPGKTPDRKFGSVTLSSFGSCSSSIGLPGDMTPPSRFIRAAFYTATAPQLQEAEQTVLQCFQILNNFDIPIGIEFSEGMTPVDIPSATQWTTVTDICNRRIYYRTMYNSAIRCFDLNTVDFSTVKYHSKSLDDVTRQPITMIKVE